MMLMILELVLAFVLIIVLVYLGVWLLAMVVLIGGVVLIAWALTMKVFYPILLTVFHTESSDAWLGVAILLGVVATFLLLLVMKIIFERVIAWSEKRGSQ